MKIIPLRLIEARKRRSMTQRDLADALGVTVQAISQWENGKTDATSRLSRLSTALHCNPDFLTNPDHHEFGEEKTDPLIELTANVPIIDMNDLPYYLSFDLTGKSPKFESYISSTTHPVGSLFGIIADEDGSDYNQGDILIFDNGIEALPGDMAAMIVLGESWAQVNTGGSRDRAMENIRGLIARLGSGKSAEATPLRPMLVEDETTGKPTVGAVLIVGTLVEHRTFRRRGKVT